VLSISFTSLGVRLVRQMRPSQIGSREDRARRPCRSPAVLQGLTGIVIPSRKTQARHSGQLCSIRGKSGGARSGGEPYRRVGQTSDRSKSRRALRVAPGFALFSSLVRLLIAVDLKGHPLTCARAGSRCRRRSMLIASKSAIPAVPGDVRRSLAKISSASRRTRMVQRS